MPNITLPDGKQLQFDSAVTVAEVAANIGAGLAKAALAGKVNDKLVDLSHSIDTDTNIAIITEKDPEGLEIIRHSTAHLLAQAVKALFPTAQVTIGPVVDDGFYYDFAFGRSFTPEDLEKIEAKMYELAKQGAEVTRSTITREDAMAYFHDLGEHYKEKIIADLPEGEVISLYKQADFVDLCRGPHVPNTNRLKAFKLTKLAGAYWRGDSNNEMLQRVYGTAWANKKDLAAYLHRIEEAEKRDHRKLAKQLDLFHIQEEAPGMVFWHPNGWTIYQVIEQYMRQKLIDHGYCEVHTPQMVDLSLWKRSGHWEKYQDNMFVTEAENHDFAIKPMSCPCHIQIFNQGLKSYRDLPLRIHEFGNCHRHEYSGTLHGLMRVRNFTQDDAHVFCTEDQIDTEIEKLINLVFEIYQDFGFSDVSCKLSTRPEMRVGSEEVWDKAESALERVLNQSEMDWTICPEEGAFYGPKIDFDLRDCLGRVWQCGTIQLDFSMPGRLGAEYVDEDGTRKTPVMIHRAIMGSFERFIGVLIEHYAGKFPPWLAFTQAVILNITDRQVDYANELASKLKSQGFRVDLDLRNEKVGFKIREHTLKGVPYQLIIGDREVETQTISVRTNKGEDLGSLSLEEFSQRLSSEIADKGRLAK